MYFMTSANNYQKGYNSRSVQHQSEAIKSNVMYPDYIFANYPDMLNLHQVMAALNVTEYTARSLIRSGELKSKVIRGAYRVPKSSLYEYTYGSATQDTQSKKADEQPTLYLLRRVC